ncbi:MAG: FAD-dependent oxidoreductase [Myxococcota bacterium]
MLRYTKKLAALLSAGCALTMAAGCAGEDSQDALDERADIAFDRKVECDVIVAGGSAAALSAALTSAREGRQTCLLEPTDWVGGQFTSGGVPAVDFAWHNNGDLPVGAIAKDPANIPPELLDLLTPHEDKSLNTCTVSWYCFRPDSFAVDQLEPLVEQVAQQTGNLEVFYNTVVKQTTSGRFSTGEIRIDAVTAIQRTAKAGVENNGFDDFLHNRLEDWYSLSEAGSFTKEVLRFEGRAGQAPVVIDATEFGDVMALTTWDSYLQGVETADGSAETLDSTCGQATVFPFIQRYATGPRTEPGNPFGEPENPDFYQLGNYDWRGIWKYRRVVEAGHPDGFYNDATLQNWYPGNDYPFGYLFLSTDETRQQAGTDWRGGINMAALAGAERHAIGWHFWFKNHPEVPNGENDFIVLDRQYMGTTTGLSKMPYLRDTRRSIGLDDFVLSSNDIRGTAAAGTGTVFDDRIAIGAYAVDFHNVTTCNMPAYVNEVDHTSTLPYYIPFRALTNRDVGNLLVAGKTMAQSFVANAAIRLHPIEWTTGIGAGAAAAYMSETGVRSRDALGAIRTIQDRIREYAPIDWTM